MKLHPVLSTYKIVKAKAFNEDIDDSWINWEYMDFYLLCFAKDDLTDSEVQWYWEGATRQNIDLIIRERFQQWMQKFEQSLRELKKLPSAPFVFWKYSSHFGTVMRGAVF